MTRLGECAKIARRRRGPIEVHGLGFTSSQTHGVRPRAGFIRVDAGVEEADNCI